MSDDVIHSNEPYEAKDGFPTTTWQRRAAERCKRVLVGVQAEVVDEWERIICEESAGVERELTAADDEVERVQRISCKYADELSEAVALLRRLDEAGSGDEYAEIVQLDVRAFLAKHGGER